jgi:hypothetical protein
MKIIYKTPDEQPAVTFDQVEQNQFFINASHELCQKRISCTYIIIAKSDGTPYADYVLDVSPDQRILRILPQVERIEF